MTDAASGVVTIPTQHSVDEAVRRLEQMLADRDIQLFALVDHSGEAEKAGLQMPPTKLVIFGSPKAGTPLMLATPSIAIDLPLKLLIWEDKSGSVLISYNAPAYLMARHGLPSDLLANIAVIEKLATAVAG